MRETPEPRTEAGRDTLADPYFAPPGTPFYDALKRQIIAIELEASLSLPASKALLRRWRDASLGGDVSDLVDLTNETTDFLGDGDSAEDHQPNVLRPT